MQIPPKPKVTWVWDWDTGVLEIEMWAGDKLIFSETLTGQKAWNVHSKLEKIRDKPAQE